MESSILSEVDDPSILRTGLPTPLCLSSQLATGLSPRAPRSGLERSDFVHWHNPAAPPDSQWVRLLRYCGPSVVSRVNVTWLRGTNNNRALLQAHFPARLRQARLWP